jgi:hypothetical protein
VRPVRRRRFEFSLGFAPPRPSAPSVRGSMQRHAVLWAVLLAELLTARSGKAQCGANHSSCSACHDGVQAGGPSQKAWHEQHAFADLCPLCHGGSGEATDVAQAHVGLVDPLASETACASCHGSSTSAFVARYRLAHSQDADAGTTATTTPPGKGTPLRPPPHASQPHGDSGPNLAMAGIVLVIGAAGTFFVMRQERERAQRAARPFADSVSSV